MAHGDLEWMELPAPDPEALASFYERTFGWTIQRDAQFENYLMFRDAGGKMGGAFTAQHRPSEEPGIVLYITVDDIDQTQERVAEEGGTPLQGRTLITEEIGWWGTFRDPAGNVVGLYQNP